MPINCLQTQHHMHAGLLCAWMCGGRHWHDILQIHPHKCGVHQRSGAGVSLGQEVLAHGLPCGSPVGELHGHHVFRELLWAHSELEFDCVQKPVYSD